VNRASVELYLDVPGVAGNTLTDVDVSRHSLTNLTYRRHVGAVPMEAYVRVAAGLVVYDPSRPESIDIGTVMAAQQHAVLVGPDLAGSLAARTASRSSSTTPAEGTGRPFDPIGAYDRALRECILLVPVPSRDSAPRPVGDRDYLVQTGTFVFYFSKGSWIAVRERRDDAGPPGRSRGIPILGWFTARR